MMVACAVEMDGTGSTGCTHGIQPRPLDVSIGDIPRPKEPLKKTCPVSFIPFTLWLFNIAMEHGPFIDGLPIKNGDFPWLC